MAMADRSEEFTGLDGFFRAARAAAPEPSATLMDRILAEAAALQPVPAAAAVPVRRAARAGFLQRLFFPGFGGPGVIAGLACAAVAGVWIGFSQPAPLAGLASQVTGQSETLDQVDLIPALDGYLVASAGD